MIQTASILNKVSGLFRKYGIKSLTMDDIARELGMSKKTLYLIVREKTELVESVFKNDYFDFKAKLYKVLSEPTDPIEQLIKINGLILDFLKNYRPVLEFDLKKYYPSILEEMKCNYFSLFESAISTNIMAGKKAGLYRIEIDESIITKLYVSRIEQVPFSEQITLDEYTSPYFIKEVCLFHLNGLATKKGRDLIKKYSKQIENIY